LPQNKKIQILTKKVSAFPFPTEIIAHGAPEQAQVVKLSTQGFMMETTSSHMRPGDKIDFTFKMPVLNHLIQSQGVVIKIYSQFSGASKDQQTGESNNLIEVHFKNLSVDQKNHIYDFLKRLQMSKAS
jgi:hypothetical protein